MKKVMLSLYDYPTAKIVDEVGVDYILVGDSLANVILGHKDTKSITMQEMLHHTKAVAKGVDKSLVIGDMPINSYDTNEDALKNALLFLEAGANGVKIEGNKIDIVKTLVENNIKTIGHLGLLPQTAKDYKVQGIDEESAEKILQDAIDLDNAGIIALVLECVPMDLAKKITETVSCPTIGIGSGKYCSGQVLVLHDIIGLSDFDKKIVKKYANVKEQIKNAVSQFKEEVINEKFPTEENSFK